MQIRDKEVSRAQKVVMMLVDHKRKWFPFFTICLELNDKRERRKQTNSLGGLLVACVTNKVTPV